MIKKLLLLLVLALSSLLPANAQDYFKNFPENADPSLVGKGLAYHLLDMKHALYVGKWIGYYEVFTWNGALKYADDTNDKELLKKLKDRFDLLFSEEKAYMPPHTHVDLNTFGSLCFELYRITKEKKYLDLGLSYAESQWNAPKDAKPEAKKWDEMGYTWQTRLWIDDMYMVPILQTEAFKATNDRKYIDRAAKEMVLYLEVLQKPNGLFYHAPDVPFYWSRGNGWIAAGMTELLSYLPKDSKYRPIIMRHYLLMMNNLLQYQNKDGLWNQLIDQEDFWTETSGSAMFAFSFIQGVKKGWLDKKVFGPAARKAWITLVSYINDNNEVSSVCIGTDRKNDRQYYYDRKRCVGDYHGQAPYLWCVNALMED